MAAAAGAGWCCCFLLPLLHKAHTSTVHMHAYKRPKALTRKRIHTYTQIQYTSHRCTHGCTAKLRPKRFERGISVDMLNVLSCVFYYFVLSLSFPFDVCARLTHRNASEPFTSKYDTHLPPNTTHTLIQSKTAHRYLSVW